MTAVAELQLTEIEEMPPAEKPRAHLTLVDNSPMARMMAALDRGVSPDQVGQMMALQERYDANEARKAFHIAFAAFKAEAIEIVKNKHVTDGPLKGKSYAELFSVVDAVTPALSKHGLSTSWSLTRDEPAWIEVTCTLAHAQGHCEKVSMGAPPDTTGAKNAVQARGSTKSYLERYTVKAILGVAEKGEDDDGAGGAKAALVDTWLARVKEAQSYEDTNRLHREGSEAFNKAKDVDGYKQFAAAIQARRNELRRKEASHA